MMKIIKKFFSIIFYLASAISFGIAICIATGKTEYSSDIALMMVGVCIFMFIIGTQIHASYQFVRRQRMKTIRIFFKLTLIVYLITLLWLSIADGVFDRNKIDMVKSFDEYVDRFNYLFNFMPSETIRANLENINTDTRNCLVNIFGNIGLFVPFGILVPCCFRSQRKYGVFLLNLLLVIIVIELLQILTGTGTFDIDDIILNFIGGTLGFAITAIKPIRRSIEKTNFKRY